MNGLIFKITVRRQFIAARGILFTIALLWFIYFLFYGMSFIQTVVNIYFGTFVLFCGPALFLHIQYWRANGGAALIIDKSTRTLIYESPDEVLSYEFEDIIGFEHFFCEPTNGGRWLPMNAYRYFRITFKDNRRVAVTCLMMEDIDQEFEMLLALKAEKKFRFLPYIMKR